MKRSAIIGAAALLLVAIIWLIPWPHWRYWASFLFIWFLPGIAWLPVISHWRIFTRIESLILALGLNFAAIPVLTLLVAYLPGQNPKFLLFLFIFAIILLPIPLLVFLSSHRINGEIVTSDNLDTVPRSKRKWWKKEWVWFLLVLMLAAAMRLINLGYSEFQGDEAAVLVRAARIMTGEDPVLFQHKKGPLELLLPMAGWDFTGITNEWMARLPFTLASILGVGSVFLFGRRHNNLWTAVIAGGLMAVEGYMVGFGRIVQYQSAVILLSSLALLCLLVFQQNGHHFLIVISASLFAVGSWAHYDAVLFLPAGLWLILSRLKNDEALWRDAFPSLVTAAILGMVLVGLFYYPFFRGSQAEGTLFYVSGRIGNDQLFYNHLQSTLDRIFVYDSLYLLILVFGGLGLQILFTWQRWSRGGLIVAIFLILAFCTTLLFPQWWEFGEWTLAWISLVLLLLGSLFVPKQSAGTRALWLWFGVPAIFYLYFVALPLTHVYTAVPGAVLLAGLGIYNLSQRISVRSPRTIRIATAVAILIFILSISFTIITFVSHSPEYVREYPDRKSTLFWTPFGDDLPEEGLFGFPYKAGWKTVGYLMDSGALSGSYDSNEERDVTDYYMRQAMRFDCATPDIYVIAKHVQDEVNVHYDQIDSDYQPQYVIEVDGRPKSTIFNRGVTGSVDTIAAQNYDHFYDLNTTPGAVASATPAMIGEQPGDFIPVDGQLGDFAELVGYRIETKNAAPGGYLELTLLWQALRSAPIDYQVFTHLHDGQMMRGQLDGQPVCNSAPTSSWVEGSYIVDPYRIPVHPEAAAGSVPLTVGMYNLADLQRVPVVQPSHPKSFDSIFITDVEIRENG